MKILTIAVPAYNAEKTIRECLDSMVNTTGSCNVTPNSKTGVDSRLEIIVINDGSKDSTAEIVKSYISMYPETVRLVDKENGGHGSGINAGIKAASGKYFKVIDSDDWIVSENLNSILNKLEKTDADAVITGYKSVNETTGGCQEYSSVCEQSDRVIGIDEFSKFFETMPACFQFHGLMYNTEFYRKLNITMMEKVSYEDQQYAIMPFAKAEKILILPEYLYMYRLGESGQTVNFANQAKKAGDMKSVVVNVIDYHLKCRKEDKNWTSAREEFFKKRLSIAAVSYYAVVLVKSKDKTEGRRCAEEFSTYLNEKEPEVFAHLEGKLKQLKFANRVPGVLTAYNRLSDSENFQKFKKKWNK